MGSLEVAWLLDEQHSGPVGADYGLGCVHSESVSSTMPWSPLHARATGDDAAAGGRAGIDAGVNDGLDAYCHAGQDNEHVEKNLIVRCQVP
jgi:hypothetical protein